MGLPADKSTKRHIPELDGLRGFACLLILVGHAAQQFHVSPYSQLAYGIAIFRINWIGVDLFFVLSGYLLGGICMDNQHSANYFRAFYTRRACRIFPLYYAWLLIISVLAFWKVLSPEELFNGEVPYWSFWLYVQNFYMGMGASCPRWISLTWSLAIEEQFYLLLPALLWLTPRKITAQMLLILIASAVVCRAVLVFGYPSGAEHANYHLTFARWDTLFIGVLGAWMVRQPNWLMRIQNNQVRLIGLAAILGIVIVGISFGPLARLHVQLSIALYSLIAIFFMSIIFLALFNSRTAWFFRRRSLMFLGTISYGTYLFHEVVIELARKYTNDDGSSNLRTFVVVSLAIAATMGLAKVSYHFFEKPIIRIGHRTSYQLEDGAVK